jgi:soluble lytic murein transglycosylase-like protein
MIKPKQTSKLKAKPTKSTQKSSSRKKAVVAAPVPKIHLSLLVLEGLSWLICASLVTMLTLGYAAQRFTGTDLFANLLPFTLGIVAWIVLLTLLLIVWLRVRRVLVKYATFLPLLVTLALMSTVLWQLSQMQYEALLTDFRTLVGGKQQAEKVSLSHQVYAAYRRYDQADLQKMIERSETYKKDVLEAASNFNLDADILLGVAATESSFLPRDSHDGGHGLFQITAVPKFLLDQVRQKLAVDKLSILEHRHNAFVAAATLKYYLAEMNDDLFLGLLAYNIGPRNGGLKFIMQQYGANDFITMQPYLQQLPRDYPIRVLSYSLAFRLWHHEGKLLPYQEGDNAVHIQQIGIPGLIISVFN